MKSLGTYPLKDAYNSGGLHPADPRILTIRKIVLLGYQWAERLFPSSPLQFAGIEKERSLSRIAVAPGTHIWPWHLGLL